MPTFQLSMSSSPPTTPNAKWPSPEANTRIPAVSDMAEEPSTTPAGPPPRSAASFTPAGSPPSTTFGSSQFGTNVSKLRFATQATQPDSRRATGWQPQRTKNGTPGGVLGRKTAQLPDSSPLSRGYSFDRSLANAPQEENEDDFGSSFEDSMQMDQSIGLDDTAGSPAFRGFTAVNSQPAPRSSLIGSRSDISTPSNLQQSIFRNHTPVMSHQLPRKGRPDVIPNLARDLATRSEPAALTEPDEMILATEAILTELHEGIRQSTDEDQLMSVFAIQSLELMRLWNSCAPPEQNLGEGIGPGPDASPLQKATYLSSLSLVLHHPPFLSPSSAFKSTIDSRSLIARPRPMPTPKILIDWLNRYHLSYGDLFDVVRSTGPNCTAHEQFWDLAFGMLLRGQTAEVRRLFAEADFHHAISTFDEGKEKPGYHGAQLQAVQAAVHRASEVLKLCPATQGDWQVDDSEWELFKGRVSLELKHLAESGGSGGDENGSPPSFQTENFGLPKAGRPLPRPSQPGQRKLPWSIHQNLKILYGILLGNADEIMAQSQDWLEATAALTIWWDGAEDTDIARWSLNVSQARQDNEPQDIGDPYLRRLRAAFLCVTDPECSESFVVNPQSQLEVGLACILQGESEGVLGCLGTFSLVIASAVAEVGGAGGWLKSVDPGEGPALDQDDLIVLSYGGSSGATPPDRILVQYAQRLFDRRELVDDGNSCEGWELAISVANRIQDHDLATESTTSFVDQLDLDSQSRLDKLLALCTSIGLENEARKVSERFADRLSSNTTLYGTALLCYARSHCAAKIRQLVDLLVSYSLVRSAAYPPAPELDDDLRALVENPKRPLAKLNQIDPEAAATLQFYLAGYACLRRFYHLRDEQVAAASVDPLSGSSGGSTTKTSSMSPLSRKRAAAKSLIAVLSSAADAIYGGLYDADRESAIQVDGLLVLLGEVSALVADQQQDRDQGTETSVLSSTQIYDVLAAIEDVQTVNSRVYQAAEDCLRVSLQGYSDPGVVAVPALGSNTSFSMLGSDMSTSGAGGRSVGGSGVLVQASEDDSDENMDSKPIENAREVVQRGWDWRRRFTGNGKADVANDAGREILSFLRRALARELPFAELLEQQRQRQQQPQQGWGRGVRYW